MYPSGLRPHGFPWKAIMVMQIVTIRGARGPVVGGESLDERSGLRVTAADRSGAGTSVSVQPGGGPNAARWSHSLHDGGLEGTAMSTAEPSAAARRPLQRRPDRSHCTGTSITASQLLRGTAAGLLLDLARQPRIAGDHEAGHCPAGDSVAVQEWRARHRWRLSLHVPHLVLAEEVRQGVRRAVRRCGDPLSRDRRRLPGRNVA
jgi:hypothetical protein